MSYIVSTKRNIRTIKALRGEALIIDLKMTHTGTLSAWMKKSPDSATYRSFEIENNRILRLPKEKTQDYYDSDDNLLEEISGKWYFDVMRIPEGGTADQSHVIYTGTILFKDQITGSRGVEISDPNTGLFSRFIQLTDTPSSYGSVGQIPAVNSDANGLVWADIPTPTFVSLPDTPSSFGTAGQTLVVNSEGDALEWATSTTPTLEEVTQSGAETSQEISINSAFGPATFTTRVNGRGLEFENTIQQGLVTSLLPSGGLQSSVILNLPSEGGTLALLSDIPTIPESQNFDFWNVSTDAQNRKRVQFGNSSGLSIEFDSQANQGSTDNLVVTARNVFFNLSGDIDVTGDIDISQDHSLRFNSATQTNGQVSLNPQFTESAINLNLPSESGDLARIEDITGLQRARYGSNFGYRIKEFPTSNYSGLGENAIDMSLASTSGARGAVGQMSFATGINTNAGERYSAVFNQETSATGLSSFAANIMTNAVGNASACFGQRHTAGSLAEFVVGIYSTNAGGAAQAWVATDRVFNVGNGNADNNRSDALTVLKNGLVTAPSLTDALIDSSQNSLIKKSYADSRYLARVSSLTTFTSAALNTAYPIAQNKVGTIVISETSTDFNMYVRKSETVWMQVSATQI